MPKVSAVALHEGPEGLAEAAPLKLPDLWQRYAGALQFRERVYGGIPKNPHIFDSWLKAKQFPPDLVQENKDDVAGELEESVEAGETVFRRDSTGLYLRQFQLKGATKEATQRLGYYVKLKRNEDQMGLRSHIQTGLYIEPRNLYLLRDGKPIREPDGYDEAQGRVPTPKGPKSILRKSEYVERPTIEFQLKLLPFKGFGYAELVRVLTLVCEIGVGSWRSREEGKLDLLAFAPIEAA